MSSRGDCEKEVFVKGNTELGAWLVWRSWGGSQNSSLKVISQMLEDSNQYKYRDYNFCIFCF